MTMSRGFQCFPSTDTHHHRMTVLNATRATIGQPSHGMNGRCIDATSTMHDNSSKECILTITG
jgi:hypothetical protein